MLMLLRFSVIVLSGLIGYILGNTYNQPFIFYAGILIGIAIISFEMFSKKISIGRFFGGLIGLMAGLIFGTYLVFPFKRLMVPLYYDYLHALSTIIFSYAGLIIGFIKGKEIRLNNLIKFLKGQPVQENLKILDTSVIIDGRIADITETGFIEGTFILPEFILRELQYIADSHDPLKRARGRRGLDILHKIQKMPNVEVRIVEKDFPQIKEVDSKLITLAKSLNAKVITNDFNLNKVAEVQGVPVLNINELSNALRPVVLPGESMNIFVMKEGKEYNQGVAYLEDGTMVVVENGRRFIGRNINVVVTSVLQTTAGRMIFTRPSDESERDEVRTSR